MAFTTAFQDSQHTCIDMGAGSVLGRADSIQAERRELRLEVLGRLGMSDVLAQEQ